MATTTDGTYVVTGAKGGVHERLEIRDLQTKQPKQFTLFILAFAKIREADYQPAAARFIELAGIHGLPYQQWQGDPNGQSAGNPGQNKQWGGYCHHASVIFPLWHRPHLLALEQSISEAAHSFATEFGERYPSEAKAWTEAAEALRFPFWDWTLPITGTEGLPDVLKPGSLKLIMPGETYKEVENILAYYKFGKTLPDGFVDKDEKDNELLPPGTGTTAYFSVWDRTYRWPSSEPVNPKEDYQQINDILTDKAANPRGGYKNLMNDVANMFAFDESVKDPNWHPYIWDNFSNTTFETKGLAPLPSMANSIEHPHNTVHLLLGGIGSMGDNDYAGFDPIFFLHHCQVDRLLAHWEFVYPDYWMGKGYINEDGKLQKFADRDGTWSKIKGEPVNEDTGIVPFLKEAPSTYWTAQETRLMGNFSMGYTYPSIAGVKIDQPALPSQRAEYLGALQRHFGMNPKKVRDAVAVLKPSIFHDDVSAKLPSGYVAVKAFRHFALRAEVSEFAFSSSYSLEFLYKNSSGTVVSVGAVPVLGRGSATRCAACTTRQARGNKVHGVVTIDTDIIADIITKEQLNTTTATDEEIINVIKRNIYANLCTPFGNVIAFAHEGVAMSDGNRLATASAPKVSILSGNVAHPEGEADTGPLSYYDIVDHGEHLSDHQWQIFEP